MALRSDAVKAMYNVDRITHTTLIPPTKIVVNMEGFNIKCKAVGMIDESTKTARHIARTFVKNFLILRFTLLHTNHIRIPCRIITSAR